MKINKYKKLANGKYKLYLDDNTNLELYEDVILKYELLLKKCINNNQIKDINNYNKLCEIYYFSIKSLKSRFKSIMDLKKLLISKNYSIDMIELTLTKLLQQGYLNDDSFSRSFINNQIITTNNGPLKIKRELIKKGVSIDLIDNNILIFDKDIQIQKINKLISRLIKTNKRCGGIVLRKKICSYLFNLGYDGSLVNSEITKYDFSNNVDIYKKEYNKLYNKLKSKYDGSELEYKIKEKLYLKGLRDDS